MVAKPNHTLQRVWRPISYASTTVLEQTWQLEPGLEPKLRTTGRGPCHRLLVVYTACLPLPPPTVFCTLLATLSPSDSRFAIPLFETYSAAPGSRTGSHVCVHLNASLLPTPFLGRSESLQYLPVAKGGIVFFFLCCRIALDSCGQIVARSQKEIENQLTYGKQQETTQLTPTNQGKGELK